jgi:hypothetical protein
MKFQLALLLVLSMTSSFGQSKVRLPIWTFNTKNTKIYGLSVGYMATERMENITSNGIRFELLGLGILLPLIPEAPIANDDSTHNEYIAAEYSEYINGINLSPLGHGCDCKINGINIYGVGSITGQVNGISAGIVMNITETQNGLQIAGMNWTYNLYGAQIGIMSNNANGTVKGIQISSQNNARDLKGVQIGIVNKASKVKGIQIGIWNVNEKRKSPLLNF